MLTWRRLAFALENLSEDQWKEFEVFVGAYMASEFEGFRRTGGTGDLGRDGALFETEYEGVIIQTSVAKDWRAKINATVTRLNEAGLRLSQLVYCTNQDVGPRADGLKRELRGIGIALDVRDGSYFVDRREESDGTRASAETLERLVVDPLLPATEGLTRNSGITEPDLRAGLLYLELQLHDSAGDRGLTKLSYDAIVLSTLSGTGPESRMTRAEIRDRILKSFPGHGRDRTEDLVSAALERLRKKKRITIDVKHDSFALHYSERVALVDKAAAISDERRAFRNDLQLLLLRTAEELEFAEGVAREEAVLDVLEAVFEDLLHQQGNEFAEAVRSHRAAAKRVEVFDIARRVVALRESALEPLIRKTPHVLTDYAELAAEVVTGALVAPSPAIQSYLRGLADAYTLLAFLQDTPDVQRAVSTLFSRGRLICDTYVLLPCLVESVLPREQRRYTNLLSVAREAGMTLEVTDGVLNEIERHLSGSLMCSRTPRGQWRSRVPLVLRMWREFKGSGAGLPDFIETVVGDRPLDDIAGFLESEVGVGRVNLTSARLALPEKDRWQFAEIWRELKAKQRPELDEQALDILLSHDTEMYLGVLGLRTREKSDVFGYEAWWLTGDSTAFWIGGDARRQGIEFRSNPTMHPNFLSNLLGIGPSRTQLGREAKRLLPVAISVRRQGWGLDELSDAADSIRSRYADKPEYYIRRKTRESMDKLKGSRTRDHEAEIGGDDNDVEILTPEGTGREGAPASRRAKKSRRSRPSLRSRPD